MRCDPQRQVTGPGESGGGDGGIEALADPPSSEPLTAFGEQGVVELTTLIGYFAMVSWLMNVARTPAQAGATGPGIEAFPA